jgi:hypothetical protein
MPGGLGSLPALSCLSSTNDAFHKADEQASRKHRRQQDSHLIMRCRILSLTSALILPFTHIRAMLSPVVKSFSMVMLAGRFVTPQAIAIDEIYSNQDPTIIDTRLAIALRKERLKRHLCIRQPE